MNPPVITPTLPQVASTLAQAFEARLIPASGDIPCEQLFLGLEPDEEGRPRRLELVFLPDADEFECLQFFVLLPFAAEESHLDAVARLILRFNAKLPLVGFGLLEQADGEEHSQSGTLFFRCIVPCPRGELDAEMVLQTSWLIAHILDGLSPLLEGVASGELLLDQATQEAASRFTS